MVPDNSFVFCVAALAVLCGGSCSTSTKNKSDSMVGADCIDSRNDLQSASVTTIDVALGEQESGIELLSEEVIDVETTYGLDVSEVGCTQECGSGACEFCSDNDPETVDKCDDGNCLSLFVDCDDGNECTLDFLSGCSCEHQAIESAECCVGPWHCDEPDYCSVADCVDFKCVWHVRQVAMCAQYCSEAAGSAMCVPSHICFKSYCNETSLQCEEVAKTWEEQVLANTECCVDHLDCGPGGVWEEDGDGNGTPGPDVPETIDLCVDGLCQHVAEEVCSCLGEIPNECPDDGMEGTDEVCVGKCFCASIPNSQWCQHDDDCLTGSPAFQGLCINNACQIMDSPSHECVDGSSDPFQCDDNNPCTVDWCAPTEECVHGPVPTAGMQGCCLIDADCSICADDEKYYCGEGNQCEKGLSDRAP